MASLNLYESILDKINAEKKLRAKDEAMMIRQQKAENRAERSREFLCAVRAARMRSSMTRSANALCEQREAIEEAAMMERDRSQRINELYSIIARLRQELVTSGYDPAVESELSMLQTELYWLLFAI